MDFLSRYESQQDSGGQFNDALDSYLEDNYTHLDGDYWIDDDDNQVFTCSDDVTFEGGEEGDGFKDYKSLVDEPEELAEVIHTLSVEFSSRKSTLLQEITRLRTLVKTLRDEAKK